MAFPKTKVEVFEIGGKTLMRNTFEPGWEWSEHVKPSARTNSCQVHHNTLYRFRKPQVRYGQW